MNDVKLYKNVYFGNECIFGAYVIIGRPARDKNDGEVATRIGDRACIRSHTVIYAGNVIGLDFQTGHHVMIREDNIIGNNVSVGTQSIIEHHVSVGNNVRIHSQAFIPEYTIIEDDCWIGPNVVFTNAQYPCSPNVKNELQGPVIKRGAKIGANATILPGVVVGENALIGAGAVVTKNVLPGAVVVGNPAKQIKCIGELPY